MKKILFLTYYYPPQKYPRSIQISHLYNALEKNFEVKVITSDSNHNNDDSMLHFAKIEHADIACKSYLTSFIENSKGSRFKKVLLPDHAYLWHFDLYKKSVDVIDAFAPDLIITFGQPMSTHIAGLKLKKKYPGIKWFAHFSDPWVDNMFNQYSMWVTFMNKHYQDKVLECCDNAIFTSQETIELVTGAYPAHIRKKSFCLPHIFDDSLYEANAHTRSKSFMIRYLGNFYGERQPKYLFEAINCLPASITDSLHIELIGSSDEDTVALLKLYNLSHIVSIKDPVTYMDSLVLMRHSDLLLIIDAPSELSPFLPSKLIDYIGANKPIFGITPPGTSQKLIESMGFLVANPNHPQEIALKLSQMIQLVKSGESTRAPESIRDHFSSQEVGKVFADFIHNMLSETMLS